jgi:D-aminoacyl-tRNA deacylase
VYEIASGILVASSRQGIVFVDNLDEFFRADRIVFISRHYAESGIPSMTAHFTGNFGRADFGGKPEEIARFSPALLKNYMLELKKVSGEVASTYNITLEATHHGPTSLKPPVLFVELGSTPDQWQDTVAAEKISKALISSLKSQRTYERCAICVGGTHYSDKFNEFIFDSEIALGPIIPKYALQFFNSAILKQIVEKSDLKILFALIDKKGLGKYKTDVLKIIDDYGLEKIFT